MMCPVPADGMVPRIVLQPVVPRGRPRLPVPKDPRGQMMDERYAAKSDIPARSYIGTVVAPTGDAIVVALGVCVCNETGGESKGKYWIRAGEQWACPECDRTYMFDGEHIDMAEPDHI